MLVPAVFLAWIFIFVKSLFIFLNNTFLYKKARPRWLPSAVGIGSIRGRDKTGFVIQSLHYGLGSAVAMHAASSLWTHIVQQAGITAVAYADQVVNPCAQEVLTHIGLVHAPYINEAICGNEKPHNSKY